MIEMVTLAQILADPLFGVQAAEYYAMGVPGSQIIALFGAHVGATSVGIASTIGDPVYLSVIPEEIQLPDAPIPVITGPVDAVYESVVAFASYPLSDVGMGAIVSVLSGMTYPALAAAWPTIIAILKTYGIVMALDEAWETIVGGEGIRLPFEVDDALRNALNLMAGAVPATGTGTGLHSAQGWVLKQCTKYVRGQAKQYDAMYKPMKTFTNAEKNGYSMGHRVASVWWSKALRRAKKRSYRAGQRKMQEKMMMYGNMRGMPGNIMIDT